MTEKGTFDLKLAQTCAKAFAVSCGIGCVVSDASGNVKYEYGYGCSSCQLCQAAGRGDQECIQAHNYGMEESARFGGKYIYFCPMGLVCFVSPILGERSIEARLTVGPLLLVEQQDYITCDLEGQNGLTGPALEHAVGVLQNIPYVAADKVSQMSTLHFMAVNSINHVSDANRMLETQGADAVQGQITAYLQQLKHDSTAAPYPFEKERALLHCVRQANREDTNRLLNELLSHILFSSAGDLSYIKARIYELFTQITRTAIEAGADPDQTLQSNSSYFLKISQISDFNSLCHWMVRVTNTLIDHIFQATSAQHASTIHQSVHYINAHYNEKITLEAMARRAYLSPSYFSRIFKEETGEPFSNFLNRVRIERSKELLRHKNLRLIDIAQLVGFADQSYYSKVFKRIEGISPLQYRLSEGAPIVHPEPSSP